MGKTVVIESEQLTEEAVKDTEVPFLELTICPTYHSAYKDDILAIYGISKSGYRYGGQYSPSINKTNVDLRSIFEEITYDARELLYRIKFFVNDNVEYKFVIDFEKTETLPHLHITTKYWPNFGRCYGVRPKDHIVKKGIARISITARKDIYIYFGHPGQFLYSTRIKVHVYCSLIIFSIALTVILYRITL